MDKEGFSGHDGRTTIFDYWSIDTLCRAAQKKLTPEEKELFDLHKRTMLIARKEKAVSEGVFFDLMYVNRHLERQYSFLRKAGKDLLLVAVNFEDQEVEVNIALPAHAFDYLKMEETVTMATDLLTKEKQSMMLRRDGTVRMMIGSRGARVWKLKV